MHSKDPYKQTEALAECFWQEFADILAAVTDVDDDEADFTKFCFADIRFAEEQVLVSCRFDEAVFSTKCDLFATSITFEKDVSFEGAVFQEGADFRFVKFKGDASFEKCIFEENAVFSVAEFRGKTSFAKALFKKQAFFTVGKFFDDAFFSQTVFSQEVYFGGAVFEGEAFFVDATFTQKAYFKDTEFYGKARWCDCSFVSVASFAGTNFHRQLSDEPSTDFRSVKFNDPEGVMFDDVDLSRALFRGSDVTRILFTSSVKWGKRSDGRSGMIFDESFFLNQLCANVLTGTASIDDYSREYEKVGQTYLQLIKNYDSRLDYRMADNFHFGQMEMRRLSVPQKGFFLKLRKWWHLRLSLVALYRSASDYGNSYAKPVIWILVLLILFALVFPLPGIGLQHAEPRYTETYTSVWHATRSINRRILWEAGLLLESVLTTIDTATFQKGAEYVPTYPWGRGLAICETLAVSILFALFLLAIRRQFRR